MNLSGGISLTQRFSVELMLPKQVAIRSTGETPSITQSSGAFSCCTYFVCFWWCGFGVFFVFSSPLLPFSIAAAFIYILKWVAACMLLGGHYSEQSGHNSHRKYSGRKPKIKQNASTFRFSSSLDSQPEFTEKSEVIKPSKWTLTQVWLNLGVTGEAGCPLHGKFMGLCRNLLKPGGCQVQLSFAWGFWVSSNLSQSKTQEVGSHADLNQRKCLSDPLQTYCAKFHIAQVHECLNISKKYHLHCYL